MRRDRAGDPLDEQLDPEDDLTPPEHSCDDGWLDADAEVLTPCPTCRPHLTTRRNPR